MSVFDFRKSSDIFIFSICYINYVADHNYKYNLCSFFSMPMFI